MGFEIFTYPFMIRALIVGSIIAVTMGFLSSFIVVRHLSFAGVGIAHIAFGGVALGVLLGVNPYITAIIFAVFGAIIIGFLSKKGSLNEDSSIGIIFSTAMALGVIFLGLKKDYNVDVMGYLFGNILSINNQDLYISLLSGTVILLFMIIFFKRMVFAAYDEEVAKINGVPVQFLFYSFLILVSIEIVISIKMLGIILVSAILVIPGATAFLITYDFKLLTLFSVIIGILGIFFGLYFSYLLNLSSGASIVVVDAAIFLFFLITYPKRRIKLKE